MKNLNFHKKENLFAKTKSRKKVKCLCSILVCALVFTMMPLQFNKEVVNADEVITQQDAIINAAMAKQGMTASHFGFSGAWCTLFINWAMQAVGLNDGIIYPKGGLGSSADFAKHYLQQGTYVSLYSSGPGYLGAGTVVNKNYIPKKGDIAIFKSTSTLNHVGLVASVTLVNNIPNKITIIHGNWSSKVSLTVFDAHAMTYGSQIVGYATPNYYNQNGLTPQVVPEQVFTNMNKTGKVNTSSSYLNVRSGPGTTYKTIGQLKKGQSVTITAKSELWYKIKFGTVDGYVNCSYIKITTPATKAKAKPKVKAKIGIVKIKKGKLNVRKSAGLKYKKIASLKKNKKVTITGTKGSWYKIKFGKKTGYVKKIFIKVQK